MDAGKLVLDQLGSRRTRLGTTIADRYQLIGLIAEGGMGAVYKARHILLDKIVAVKVLKVGDVDSTVHQRFTIEAKAAATLSHPNLMAVHDYGLLEDGSPFLVMEFIEGRSLSQVIKQTGCLEPSRALSIFLQICDGLSHAHSHGLIHRDLKPGNIILVRRAGSDEESAQIIDFGLAKRLFEPQAMTQSGQVFGTPLYMSPEQCGGKTLDQRADIYSLGCVMYESLTGLPALQGESPVVTMFKHCTEMPEPMSVKNPELHVPAEFERIIFKCMEKDPADRYSAVLEIKDELRRAQSSLQSAQTVVMPTIVFPIEALPESAMRTTGDTTPDPLRDSTDAFPPCDDVPTLAGDPTLELPPQQKELVHQRRQFRHRYVASFAIAMVTVLGCVLWNAANTPILRHKENSNSTRSDMAQSNAAQFSSGQSRPTDLPIAPKRTYSKFESLTSPPVLTPAAVPPARFAGQSGSTQPNDASASYSARKNMMSQPARQNMMSQPSPDKISGTPARPTDDIGTMRGVGAIGSKPAQAEPEVERSRSSPIVRLHKVRKPSLLKRLVSAIKRI